MAGGLSWSSWRCISAVGGRGEARASAVIMPTHRRSSAYSIGVRGNLSVARGRAPPARSSLAVTAWMAASAFSMETDLYAMSDM